VLFLNGLPALVSISKSSTRPALRAAAANRAAAVVATAVESLSEAAAAAAAIAATALDAPAANAFRAAAVAAAAVESGAAGGGGGSSPRRSRAASGARVAVHHATSVRCGSTCHNITGPVSVSGQGGGSGECVRVHQCRCPAKEGDAASVYG
jgi:hypothetical protein